VVYIGSRYTRFGDLGGLGENVTVRVAGRQAAKRPGAMQRPMPVIGAWFRYYFVIDKLE
jgi:hypothetical protein